MRLLITAIVTTIALSTSVYADPELPAVRKIQFDLDQLDEAGLYGLDDGTRSLSYEFCVPNDLHTIRTVQDIDPTVIIYLQSPGRIGCSPLEVLAIGETYQPNYRDVLTTLASLDAIESIEQFWGE